MTGGVSVYSAATRRRDGRDTAAARRRSTPCCHDAAAGRCGTNNSPGVHQGAELAELEEPTAWEADDINPDTLENHQRALRHQQLQAKRERRGAPPVW